MMIKGFVLVLMVSILPTVAFPCSLNFTNSTNLEAHQTVCHAAKNVETFFNDMGYSITLDNEIYFHFSIGNITSPKSSHVFFGYYDKEYGNVHIPYPELFDLDQTLFGVAITPDVTLSIIYHELFHAGIYKIFGDEHYKLSSAWHEFAAFCGQFHFMPDYLKEKIELLNPTIGPFESESYVNNLLYELAVDWFGVSAHMTCKTKGIENMLSRIINLDVYQVMHHSIP